MKTQFRKKDIKPGMVLKLRNGYIGLVAKNYTYPYDWILISHGDFSNNSSYYNDALNNTCLGSSWDIVSVYETSASNMIKLDPSKLDLIWDREEEKEYTLDELYKMVGYKLKLKENEDII